jgi:hypothetical protein
MVSSPFGRGKIATIAEVNRVRLSDDIYLEFLGEMWIFVVIAERLSPVCSVVSGCLLFCICGVLFFALSFYLPSFVRCLN